MKLEKSPEYYFSWLKDMSKPLDGTVVGALACLLRASLRNEGRSIVSLASTRNSTVEDVERELKEVCNARYLESARNRLKEIVSGERTYFSEATVETIRHLIDSDLKNGGHDLSDLAEPRRSKTVDEMRQYIGEVVSKVKIVPLPAVMAAKGHGLKEPFASGAMRLPPANYVARTKRDVRRLTPEFTKQPRGIALPSKDEPFTVLSQDARGDGARRRALFEAAKAVDVEGLAKGLKEAPHLVNCFPEGREETLLDILGGARFSAQQEGKDTTRLNAAIQVLRDAGGMLSDELKRAQARQKAENARRRP